MKIVVCGDAGVGKTSLIRCLVGLPFESDCAPTERQQIYPFESAGTFCDFWDCGPIETEQDLISLLTNASAVILAFDSTRRASLDSVRNVWLSAVKKCLGNIADSVFIMMIGCKVDRATLRDVSIEELESFATRNNLFFIEVSARDGTNADLALSILRIRAGRKSSSVVAGAGDSNKDSNKNAVPSAIKRRMSGEFDRIQRMFDLEQNQHEEEEKEKEEEEEDEEQQQPKYRQELVTKPMVDEDEDEDEDEDQQPQTMLRLHRSGSVDVSSPGLELHVSAQGKVSSNKRKQLPPPPSSKPRDLLVDVSLGGGRMGTIRVGQRDNPLLLAESFLIKHGLPRERAPELAAVVQRRIDEFLQGNEGLEEEKDEFKDRLTPSQRQLLFRTLKGKAQQQQQHPLPQRQSPHQRRRQEEEGDEEYDYLSVDRFKERLDRSMDRFGDVDEEEERQRGQGGFRAQPKQTPTVQFQQKTPPPPPARSPSFSASTTPTSTLRNGKTPPKQQTQQLQPRTPLQVDDSMRVPLFFVEVDSGAPGRPPVKLGVFRDDDLERVAMKFIEDNRLPKTKVLKLKQVLEHHMKVHVNQEKRAGRG